MVKRGTLHSHTEIKMFKTISSIVEFYLFNWGMLELEPRMPAQQVSSLPLSYLSLQTGELSSTVPSC